MQPQHPKLSWSLAGQLQQMHVLILILRLNQKGVVIARHSELEEIAAFPTLLSYQFLSQIVDVVDRSGHWPALFGGKGAHHAVVA